ARAACNTIATRFAAAADMAPTPPGGDRPVWTLVKFDELACVVDTKAEAACIDQCSGSPTPCDPLAQCEAVGTCEGTCEVCRSKGTPGSAIASMGECRGASTKTDACAPTGACQGECNGKCTNPMGWSGNGTAGCTAGCVGKCEGTCHGTCDGASVG